MAMNIVAAVLDRGPQDLAEMAVLLAIADSADKDTGEAWPSHRTIAQRARQTDRSVRNVLNRLRDAGWLTWAPRKRENGSATSNVYTLDLGKLGEAPRNHVPGTGRNDVPTPPEPRSGQGRNHVPGTPRNHVPAQNLPRRNQGARASREAQSAAPPRSPQGSGGAAQRPETGAGAQPLTPWQRTCLREEKPFVVAGELVKPGTEAFDRLQAEARADA